MGVQFYDFGKKSDGTNLMKIFGKEEEVKKAIERLKNEGCEVREPYEIEEKAHNHFTCIFRLRIPIEEGDLEEAKEKKNETLRAGE